MISKSTASTQYEHIDLDCSYFESEEKESDSDDDQYGEESDGGHHTIERKANPFRPKYFDKPLNLNAHKYKTPKPNERRKH